MLKTICNIQVVFNKSQYVYLNDCGLVEPMERKTMRSTKTKMSRGATNFLRAQSSRTKSLFQGD